MTNTAVVTGASRGIGRALADRFSAAGWRVVGMSRPGYDFSKLEPRRFDDIDADARAVLILNAGQMDISPAKELTPVQIARAVTVNLSSPMALSAAFLRRFPNGEIAHVTSSAAKKPPPHWGLYAATKAGMDIYLHALENEGVKCFWLDPGIVDTDMQSQVRDSEFPGVEEFRAMKETDSLKSPASVAKAFFWMIDRGMASLTTAHTGREAALSETV